MLTTYIVFLVNKHSKLKETVLKKENKSVFGKTLLSLITASRPPTAANWMLCGGVVFYLFLQLLLADYGRLTSTAYNSTTVTCTPKITVEH